MYITPFQRKLWITYFRINFYLLTAACLFFFPETNLLVGWKKITSVRYMNIIILDYMNNKPQRPSLNNCIYTEIDWIVHRWIFSILTVLWSIRVNRSWYKSMTHSADFICKNRKSSHIMPEWYFLPNFFITCNIYNTSIANSPKIPGKKIKSALFC